MEYIPGDVAKYPRPTIAGYPQVYEPGNAWLHNSSIQVFKSDFVRLRELTLSYYLPQKMLNKTPFQFASLSLVARNLLLLYSQVKNVDPESNYNTSNAQGLENFGVPPVRSYGLNLMVKF